LKKGINTVEIYIHSIPLCKQALIIYKKRMLINSEEEMIELGAKLIQEKKIILLEGDLGAGKTTFTK
jgi:type II secretory pathway predicted ATPase ExeA